MPIATVTALARINIHIRILNNPPRDHTKWTATDGSRS